MINVSFSFKDLLVSQSPCNVDFESEDLGRKLLEMGCDAPIKSLFVMDGLIEHGPDPGQAPVHCGRSFLLGGPGLYKYPVRREQDLGDQGRAGPCSEDTGGPGHWHRCPSVENVSKNWGDAYANFVILQSFGRLAGLLSSLQKKFYDIFLRL